MADVFRRVTSLQDYGAPSLNAVANPDFWTGYNKTDSTPPADYEILNGWLTISDLDDHSLTVTNLLNRGIMLEIPASSTSGLYQIITSRPYDYSEKIVYIGLNAYLESGFTDFTIKLEMVEDGETPVTMWEQTGITIVADAWHSYTFTAVMPDMSAYTGYTIDAAVKVSISANAGGTATQMRLKNIFLSSPIHAMVTSMSSTDYFMEVASGRLSGKSGVNKFGENNNSAAGTTEDIWDGGGTYVFPTTADITHISQAVDQAAMRGEDVEIQGLDTNWDLTVQTVTLDATNTTTAVALTTALRRVFRMKVMADIVTDQNISAHNSGDTQDYATILAGNNQTLMAIYTVPNGKTAYINNYYGTQINVTNKTPVSTIFRLWAADRANGYEFQLKHSVGASETGTSDPKHEFVPRLKFAEKTDIKMTAYCDTNAGYVSAGFDITLEDN